MIDANEGDDPLATALDPANVLPRRVEHWFGHEPNRPFLVEADHGRRETYGSFRQLVRRWARVLHDRGVGPGDRVASFLPSSIDAHAVWLATGLLGAFEVPVNPELRGGFLRHVLDDSRATLAVVRPSQRDLVDGAGIATLTTLVAPIDGALTADVEPLAVDRLPGPDDVSCVIYTSGTTGSAKGVVITWAQMSATIGRIPRVWLSDADAVYACWPMFHVTGRSPLCTMADVGGRVVLREKFSLGDFWPDVRAHGCTSTTIGAVTALLLAVPPRADDGDHPLRHALFGKVGASGLAFLDRFGVRGLAFYGSTEAGFPILNRAVSPDNADTIGTLRPGYDARVVDPEGADVTLGHAGELWIRPPARQLVLREYLDDPERTAAAVVDGWYRTGDAVRRCAGGGFVFVDRMRDTIRRFGENISSSAIEDAVAADAEVLECAAIGVASPVTGQEIALLVVRPPGVDTDPAALAARLRDVLPRHMLPAYIALVDEFPRTPTGKVRKAELAERFVPDAAWKAPR